jgi:GGDEF domain-containing protein
MLLSRDELLSALFSETDRAQRLKMPLALIAIGIAEKQEENQADHVAADRNLWRRVTRILRCYDSVGRCTDGNFLLLLPGCTVVNARILAERIRDEVFSVPAEVGIGTTYAKACFGVASSGVRSPFVVLREIAVALQEAHAAGPGSIRSSATQRSAESEAFLIPVLPRNDLH